MTLLGRRFDLTWALALGVPVVLMLAPTIARAGGTPGVVITRTDRSIGPRARTRTTAIKLTHDAARIDSDDASVIYRKDLNTAWMIQGNSYMVMNKDAARAVRKQVQIHGDAVEARLAEALATVPPENRAMIEQMMRKQQAGTTVPGMLATAPQVTKPRRPKFTKGARDKVGPWGCDVYDGQLDGQLAQRVCATGIGDLGLNDADVEIMLYASEFFWELSSEFGGQASAPPSDLLGIEDEQGFPGYALSRKRYTNGQLDHESTVTKAERTEFDPALFSKPALKERKLGMPPQGAPK